MDPFTSSYIETALWSSTDDEGEALDKRFSISDLAADALASMIADCDAFTTAQADLLSEWSEDYSNAGHDFWLTRNRHGAGYWDHWSGYSAADADSTDPARVHGRRQQEIGRLLTEAAHAYGESYLYVGDDGKLYIS